MNILESLAKQRSIAGLDHGYYQPSQVEHIRRMVKHGSSHLQYALS